MTELDVRRDDGATCEGRLSDPLAFGGGLLLYFLFYLRFFWPGFESGREIAPGDALDFGLSTFLSPTTVWTDAMYSGYPIIADPQALSWYPVFQLLRALGVGWSVFEITGYALASATAFLLVRRLTASTLAGLFGGFVFGFSGIMLAHINHFNQVHAAAWLPLVVYGLLLVRTDRYREGTAVGALALGLMWTAGHPQLVVYGAYMCATVIAGWLWIDRPLPAIARRRLVWWGAVALLGTALAAIVIVPARELGAVSRRAEQSWDLYAAMSMPPWQLLTLIFPLSFGGFNVRAGVDIAYAGAASLVEMGAYAGLLPWALAVSAVVNRSALRSEARLWLLFGAVAVTLCLGPATPLGQLFFFAPGYASFRAPARHLFLVAFCLSMMSGIGLAAFLRDPKRHARFTAAAVAATVVAGLIGMAIFTIRSAAIFDRLAANPNYVRWTLGQPLVTSVVIVASIGAGTALVSRRIIPAAAIGLLLLTAHLCDMLVVHYVLPGYHFGYATVGSQLWELNPEMAAIRDEVKKSGGRVLAADGSHNPLLRPNLTRAWRVPAASGSGSLGIERYLDMFRMGGPGDVAPAAMLASDRAIDLFAIQYVLIPADWPVVQDMRRQSLRWQERGVSRPEYALFRNERAVPRASCVSELVPTYDALGVIRSGRLADGRMFEPSTLALIDPGALPSWQAPPIARGTPQVIEARFPGSEGDYEVDAGPYDCLLVLSEVDYPWWRVSIDGQPAASLRVDYTLIGVVVPKGRHRIRLWLEPRSVWMGGAISAAALAAGIALVVTGRRARALTARSGSEPANRA